MTQRLSKSVIDKSEPKASDYFLWDRDLKGFGLKVAKGGRKSFVVQYRQGVGRSAPTKRFTIGAFGSPWTVDTARIKAKELLGEVANGGDPASTRQAGKKIPTVSQLCDEYLKSVKDIKKPSTLATDQGRIERHIKPLLGNKRVDQVSKQVVQRFMSDVAAGKTAKDVKTQKFGRAIVTGGKGTATRTVGLLGGIFSFAVDAGWISINPVRGVKRYADKKSERFLTYEEIERLNTVVQALRDAGTNEQALNIISLLLLTGARREEISTLRWSEVDLENNFLRLDDTKTGQNIRVISDAAANLLRTIDRQSGSEFVFPSANGQSAYTGTPKVWR